MLVLVVGLALFLGVHLVPVLPPVRDALAARLANPAFVDRGRLTVGIEVSVPKGTLVIRAAEVVGVEIPRFCDHPLLEPVGAEIGFDRPMVTEPPGRMPTSPTSVSLPSGPLTSSTTKTESPYCSIGAKPGLRTAVSACVMSPIVRRAAPKSSSTGIPLAKT